MNEREMLLMLTLFELLEKPLEARELPRAWSRAEKKLENYKSKKHSQNPEDE
ncbi:MAG TPA: hypothetical protein VI386_21940 [Candidatus Sulfotelmatobacter sp.]